MSIETAEGVLNLKEMMKVSLKTSLTLLSMMTSVAFAIPPERPKQPLLSSLYVEPSGTLVAGTAPAGFFRSTDGGSHWTAVTQRPGFEQLRSSGLSPAQQICMPHDFGAYWTCTGVPENVSWIDDDGVLYQCGGEGPVLSSVDGKRWQTSTTSTKPDRCAHIAMLVKKILASARQPISQARMAAPTKDAGRGHHAPVLEDDLAVVGIMQGRGSLYATTSQRSTSDFSIRTSSDGGETWKRETFGLPANWHTFTMARVLSDAVYFFAAAEHVSGQQAALYRSVDGKKAQRMNIHIDYGTWVDVQTGPDGTIFVVTRSAIHRSDDGGKHWRALSLQGIDR